ncbi:MAG: uridine kinase [Candidatus Cyclobacteriaceae bacterium M2_1C_046]
MKPYLIGITGGSGAGKSLFLKNLLNKFKPEEVTLISQDNYYFSRDKQPVDENGVKNFDTPQSIDAAQFAEHIKRLRNNESVTLEEYTFNNPKAKPKQLTFNPSPVIVVEGLFVMYFPEIKDQLDLKVFIDAKEHIKLKRRIIRDKVERGYDLDDVLYRYEKHVMPTFYKFLDPLRHEADLVVPNNIHFEKALNVLSGFLRQKLNDYKKNIV